MALVNEFARLEGINGEFLAWNNWRTTAENIILIDVHLHLTDTDAFGTFETTIENIILFRWQCDRLIRWIGKAYLSSQDGQFDMYFERNKTSLYASCTLFQVISYFAEFEINKKSLKTFLDGLFVLTKNFKQRTDFDIDLFKQRLQETIAWCLNHFSLEDCKNSLRTPPIPPQYKGLFYDDDFKDFAPIVFHKKQAEFRRLEKQFQRDSSLEGGRLMLFFNTTTCDGIAPLDTEGLLDACDVPAWDTWVWFGKVNTVEYIIAWIPPEMLIGVDNAIRSNAVECIMWLDELPFFPHWDLLHAEGLC
jgi:hypothetical protein